MKEQIKNNGTSIYLKGASVLSVIGTVWYYFNRPEPIRLLESIPLETIEFIIKAII